MMTNFNIESLQDLSNFLYKLLNTFRNKDKEYQKVKNLIQNLLERKITPHSFLENFSFEKNYSVFLNDAINQYETINIDEIVTAEKFFEKYPPKIKQSNLIKQTSEHYNPTQIIYVDGIRGDLDEIELKKYFDNYGNVTKLFIDRSSLEEISYGFIEFENTKTVDDIIEEDVTRTVNGSLLKLEKDYSFAMGRFKINVTKISDFNNFSIPDNKIKTTINNDESKKPEITSQNLYKSDHQLNKGQKRKNSVSLEFCCPICLDDLNELNKSNKRIMTNLECGHIICNQCLDNFTISQIVTCSICQKKLKKEEFGILYIN